MKLSLADRAKSLLCEQHKRSIVYLSLARTCNLEKRALCDLCLRFSQEPVDLPQIDEFLRVLQLSTLSQFNDLKTSILSFLQKIESRVREDLSQISEQMVPASFIDYYLLSKDLTVLDYQRLAEHLSKICDFNGFKHQIKQKLNRVYQEIRIINKKLDSVNKELMVLEEYFAIDRPIYQIYKKPKATLKEQTEVSQAKHTDYQDDQFESYDGTYQQSRNNNSPQKDGNISFSQKQAIEVKSKILTAYLDSDILVCGGQAVCFYNLNSGKQEAQLKIEQQPEKGKKRAERSAVSSIACNTDNSFLVLGCEDLSIQVLKKYVGGEGYDLIQQIREHQSPILQIIFNRVSNNQFISLSRSSVLVWNRVRNSDNFILFQALKTSQNLSGMSISRDYTQLALATSGRIIQVWICLQNEFIVKQDIEHSNQFNILSISFSSGENMIAAASADNKIRLFKENEDRYFQFFQELVMHRDFIWFLKFDARVGALISCSQDRQIVVWYPGANGLWYEKASLTEEAAINCLVTQGNRVAMVLDYRRIKIYELNLY